MLIKSIQLKAVRYLKVSKLSFFLFFPMKTIHKCSMLHLFACYVLLYVYIYFEWKLIMIKYFPCQIYNLLSRNVGSISSKKH